MAKESNFLRGVNNTVSVLFGKYLEVIFVLEYPKCGGTWVSQILRHYLEVDKARGKTKIIGRRSVIQRHELPQLGHNKPVVVIRDPRDTFVSFFYFELFRNRDKNQKVLDVVGFDAKAEDAVNFQKYCEYKLSKPLDSMPHFSYEQFYQEWKSRKQRYFVKYEDLHTDPLGTVKSILEYLNIEVDDQKLTSAIEACSFKKTSGGREQGSDDPYAFRRKGIVGDWKNLFNQTARQLGGHYLGDLLIEMGYERDKNWASN